MYIDLLLHVCLISLGGLPLFEGKGEVELGERENRSVGGKKEGKAAVGGIIYERKINKKEKYHKFELEI